MTKTKKIFKRAIYALAAGLVCASAQATIVLFETNQGNFQVNLYDQGTPQTVNNFLTYVNSGAYNNSIFHRSIPNFVIQGGGFNYNTEAEFLLHNIPTNPAVINEPVYSNVRATIAMAKLDGNPNSATSQWFINLQDNSAGNAQLDSANSGYTVFGEVIGDGMAIVDQIASIPYYDLDGPFKNLPLQNYIVNTLPVESNLIIINQITVIDDSVSSAANLNPVLNQANATPPTNESSSGGGALGSTLALILMLVGFRKKI